MPKLRKPVDLGFRVPAKLADQIRAEAAQDGRTTSNLVRAICQAHYDARSLKSQLELPLEGGG